MAAQLGHARLKAVSGAQALVVKDHEQRFGRQQVIVQLAGGVAPLQVQLDVQDRFDLFFGPVQQGEKIFAFKRFCLHGCLLLFLVGFIRLYCNRLRLVSLKQARL
jgi:hypothetical protein